jgi:hypothetical protein
MDSLNWADLRRILDESDGTRVSIYLSPLIGAESRQNPAKLKALLRQAGERLGARGVRPSEVDELLAPATELVEQGATWGQFGRGMAVLLSQNGARTVQLPVPCDERCEVGANFFVLPLIEALAGDIVYFVLAVSQNQVRLFRGSRSEMEEVAVPGLPADRETAVLLEDTERTLQAHVGQSQVPGRGDLMYHGHGGAPDASKDEIEQYFRAIDRAVAQYLAGRREPLLFAGVDYLFPIYQEANTYANLVPELIPGNPELWSPKELLERAWPLIEPLGHAERDVARSKYGDMISKGRTAAGLEDVLPAAQAGAVETLFIDSRITRRGRFDPDSVAVQFDNSTNEGSEDLINLAAVLVLRSSGTVELAAADDIPGGCEAAAVLRYPFAVASGTGQRR